MRVSSKPIGLYEEVEIPKELASARVSEFILESREHDIPKLDELLSTCIMNEIWGIPVPTDDNMEDSLFWADSPLGNFFVVCLSNYCKYL